MSDEEWRPGAPLGEGKQAGTGIRHITTAEGSDVRQRLAVVSFLSFGAEQEEEILVSLSERGISNMKLCRRIHSDKPNLDSRDQSWQRI